MKPYFETISVDELLAMHQREEISNKCLDRVADYILGMEKSEYNLVDLGTFIAVLTNDNETVRHFNKFLI